MMFRTPATYIGRTNRLAILGLLALSLAALVGTVWVMIDFLREQDIVQGLIQQLPSEARAAAEELAGELRWQFRLSILVVLNVVVTAIAVQLLWRAYRMSQESLRDIKALANDILGSMDQGVITTDLEGAITSINKRGLELMAVGEDVVGRPLAEISGTIPLEEFRVETERQHLAHSSRDYVSKCKGSTRTLRAFYQPLRSHDEAETGSVLQLRDVTERVLMDERMRRMERYMGLGSLAVGLHHEIKNPLAALSLHVQLLEEHLDTGDTPVELREMLGVINAEVTRVGRVLENFRDFASVGNVECSEVDLVQLVEQQAKLIAPRAEQQGIDVHLEFPAAPLPHIHADRVRLEQVLLNLLVNAMDAMLGGGTLHVRAFPVEATASPMVKLEIVDTGCGIPSSVRNRIFDPYFTTKSEGSGMGLAICDKIIRQHHGSLDCRTSEHGTVFECMLPMEPSTIPGKEHEHE